MRIYSFGLAFMLLTNLLGDHSRADDSTAWFHPKAQQLEVSETGPFAQLKDGTLVTMRGGEALLSRDDGRTWERRQISSAHELKASPEIVMFVTREGTIIAAFLNLTQEKWGWDEKENRPVEGVRLPVWTARSTDGGQTWIDVQQIQGDWCGAVRSMIQTKDGALVLSSTHMAYPQPYHTSVTYVSNDDGKTWKRSNHIDIGGRGHHDGIVEGTLAELRDGRIWFLLRTNHDVFYQAFSKRRTQLDGRGANKDRRQQFAGTIAEVGERATRARVESIGARRPTGQLSTQRRILRTTGKLASRGAFDRLLR